MRRFSSGLLSAILLTLMALSSCTEETIINNPPTVIPDLKDPLVEWISVNGQGPGSGEDFQSAVRDTVLLTLSATDPSGIDSVRLYINGFYSPPSIEGGVGEVVSFSWNTLADSDGVYTLEARAWDGAGNVGSSPILTLRVSNTTPPASPDRTPPVIRWISPEAGAVVRDTVEFNFIVKDSSEIDSVKVFVDGEVEAILAGQADAICTVLWNSWRRANGRHIVEIRAWDSAGNAGISDPVGLNVDNHKVIWVPDDFGTIQAAINVSVDGDTIMVRGGEYHEQLQFFDKNVNFVSESGPEETIIDGTGYYTAAWVTGGQDTTMLIRGFTFSNSGEYPYERYGAYFNGASLKIVNNIFRGSPNVNRRGMQIGQNNAIIRNNLFFNLSTGIEIGHSWGSDFSNNMLVDIGGNGLWSLAATGQSLRPDYNLFWNVEHYDSTYFAYGPHNIIDQEPRFQEGTFFLEPGSPGVNQGRPDLLDPNQTRSDIGVYGGPLSYPPPNNR